MRKSEMAAREAKKKDARFAVVTLDFLEHSRIELRVAPGFVVENIDTIDSEELGVTVVFDNEYVVLESGLGGAYEDNGALEGAMMYKTSVCP